MLAMLCSPRLMDTDSLHRHQGPTDKLTLTLLTVEILTCQVSYFQLHSSEQGSQSQQSVWVFTATSAVKPPFAHLLIWFSETSTAIPEVHSHGWDIQAQSNHAKGQRTPNAWTRASITLKQMNLGH